MSEVASSVGGGATDEPPPGVDSVGASRETVAAQLVRRALAAFQEGDPLGLQAQLDLAEAVLGLAGCIDEIVLPVTRQVRGPATTGRRAEPRDVMATEAVRTWLNHRGLFAPAPLPTRPVLLACGPRDRQLVALESLALLLRFRRRPCRVLGARVSTFTLTVAAQAADAAAVVVMSADSRARPQAVDSLRAVDVMGIPAFFTGEAFDAERSRRGVPGVYLGARLADACTLLIAALNPGGQPRSDAVQGP